MLIAAKNKCSNFLLKSFRKRYWMDVLINIIFSSTHSQTKIDGDLGIRIMLQINQYNISLFINEEVVAEDSDKDDNSELTLKDGFSIS